MFGPEHGKKYAHKTRTGYGEQLCGPDGFADTTTAHRAGRRLRLNSDRALIGSEEPRSDSYILDVDSQQPCACAGVPSGAVLSSLSVTLRHLLLVRGLASGSCKSKVHEIESS